MAELLKSATQIAATRTGLFQVSLLGERLTTIALLPEEFSKVVFATSTEANQL